MRRPDNKLLLIVLLVLAGAFVLTRVFRSPARESNLDADALKVDTTGVDKILLYPSADGRKEVQLTKQSNGWNVTRDQKTGKANPDLVKSLLARIATLKPERIATRKEEKWNDYQVADTTGTDVVVFSGDDERTRIKVGKENMGVTFVRKIEDDEVYAISGAVASTFNQKLNDWRDPTLLQVAKQNIGKISFKYPADSGFVLSRNEKSWMVDNAPADSAKTENFLNKLRLKVVRDFADDFAATSQPDVTMTIETPAPIVVKGWKVSPEKWVLASDLQQGVFFLDDGAVARDIFPGKKNLLR